MTVRAAAARAPVMKTAFTPMRTLREPASRRALPMRGDIGNSARRLDIRMRDYLGKAWGVPGLCSTVGTGSPEDSLVLGLAVVVLERLQPGDEAETAPVDLVRPGVVANIVRLTRSADRPGTSERTHRRARANSRFARLGGARSARDPATSVRSRCSIFDPACQRPELDRPASASGSRRLLSAEWMAGAPRASLVPTPVESGPERNRQSDENAAITLAVQMDIVTYLSSETTL